MGSRLYTASITSVSVLPLSNFSHNRIVILGKKTALDSGAKMKNYDLNYPKEHYMAYYPCSVGYTTQTDVHYPA